MAPSHNRGHQWKKDKPADDGSAAPPNHPPPDSDGLHDGAGHVQGRIGQGFGGTIVGGFRSMAATIRNAESRDLELFIKEERDVVEAYTALMKQRAGSVDAEIRWASTKEEDIRAVSDKLNQVQQAFIQAENGYIESLEASRKVMKEIRNREKKIHEAKGRLKAAVSKRDAADKKSQPSEALTQEARQIQAEIRGMEAEHLGLTRADLKMALRLKHEASVKYAVRLSVASKFSLYLADQIPQGVLSPGQDLPPFGGAETLEKIMADFNTAFNSNELVTKIPAAAPAPTITKPYKEPGPASNRMELERTHSAAGSSTSENEFYVDGGTIHNASAEMYAAPKPEKYLAVNPTPYTAGKASPPAQIPFDSNGSSNQGYYQNQPIGHKPSYSNLQDSIAAAPQMQAYSVGYTNPNTSYASTSQPSSYYSQYLPQQPPPPQGYAQQGYNMPLPPPPSSVPQQYYAPPPPPSHPPHQQQQQMGYQQYPQQYGGDPQQQQQQQYSPPPRGDSQYHVPASSNVPPPPSGAPPSY
ncbi:hypothetical protein HDU78_005639 [Chytriomyces hyalinus]|nr:hypothetical protein HDU78_005639 [Chytriomyces hyalinus]